MIGNHDEPERRSRFQNPLRSLGQGDRKPCQRKPDEHAAGVTEKYGGAGAARKPHIEKQESDDAATERQQ